MPMNDLKPGGIPKRVFEKLKREHKGKFSQFAENIQILKKRMHHHM